MELKAPFPYFGGKSRVADVVWERLGDVYNYVEPFCGSLAVLLQRPGHHVRRCETVNDKNHFIANFWRAVKSDPEGVAEWADWPVNESDLHPRHVWLVTEGAERIAKINDDPFLYDSQVAGWWLWGQCIWIGRGWCVQKNSHQKQLPHLGTSGHGVNRQLPHLGEQGRGINRNTGRMTRREYILDQMTRIAERIRDVRVCCGDWKRVVTRGALDHGSIVGIFLDPPYSFATGRDKGCYAFEMPDTSEVFEWAVEHGDDPRLRIALCGYEGEYEMPDTWSVHKWKAGASYKTHRGDQTGNRHRERIWFSPHCLRENETLFRYAVEAWM